jgi:hypothetical protein
LALDFFPTWSISSCFHRHSFVSDSASSLRLRLVFIASSSLQCR